MGKKSIVDGSIESAFENINGPNEVGDASPLREVNDLQAQLIHMLKVAQHAQENDDLDMSVHHYHYILLLL